MATAAPPVENDEDDEDHEDHEEDEDQKKNKAVGRKEGFLDGVVGNILEFLRDVLLDGGRVGVLGKDHGDDDTGLVGDNLGADGVAEDVVFKDDEVSIVHVDAFQWVFKGILTLLEGLDGDRDEGVGGAAWVEAVKGLRDTGGEDLGVGIDAELLGGAVLEAK